MFDGNVFVLHVCREPFRLREYFVRHGGNINLIGFPPAPAHGGDLSDRRIQAREQQVDIRARFFQKGRDQSAFLIRERV